MKQTLLFPGRELYSPKDAAAFLRVHPQTFRRWAAKVGVRALVERPNCRRYSLKQVLRIGRGKAVAHGS